MKLFLILSGIVAVTQAGFRCSIGDFACTASCVVLGQSSGTCDNDNECWCSEKDIDFKAFRELLPSRCTLGKSFCEGTCNAIGRRTGSCEFGEGCECSDEFLSPSEFALCAAESTCRLDCQRQGKGTGECKGWKCECRSQLASETTEEELDESLIRDLSELTEDFSQ